MTLGRMPGNGPETRSASENRREMRESSGVVAPPPACSRTIGKNSVRYAPHAVCSLISFSVFDWSRLRNTREQHGAHRRVAEVRRLCCRRPQTSRSAVRRRPLSLPRHDQASSQRRRRMRALGTRISRDKPGRSLLALRILRSRFRAPLRRSLATPSGGGGRAERIAERVVPLTTQARGSLPTSNVGSPRPRSRRLTSAVA